MWGFVRRLVVGYLIGIPVDIIIGLLTGDALFYAGWLGIFNEALGLILSKGATTFERFALDLLIDETEHLLSELRHQEEDSQRERLAFARYLERTHPHRTYIFGNFSVADAEVLAASAFVVSNSVIPETVFQAVRGLFTVEAELI